MNSVMKMWQAWLIRCDSSKPWSHLGISLDRDDMLKFNSLTKLSLGNGKCSFFWTYALLDKTPLDSMAPYIVNEVSDQIKSSCSVVLALVNGRWLHDIEVLTSTDVFIQILNL